MTRRAILIESSNISGEKDLPGARIDIVNWEAFLRSPLGGSWSDSEILILRKPLPLILMLEIAAAANKYCFVAFSGHGSNGKIALNDSRRDFPISLLLPRGNQGTMLIDSCRGTGPAQQTEALLAKIASFLAENAVPPVSRISPEAGAALARIKTLRYRNQFDAALARATNGIVTMLSCSTGEAAGENPESGGYYTSAIIDAAFAFDTTQGTPTILNTKEAHDHAVRIMPPQQHPEYAPLGLAFPFAVKIPDGYKPVI